MPEIITISTYSCAPPILPNTRRQHTESGEIVLGPLAPVAEPKDPNDLFGEEEYPLNQAINKMLWEIDMLPERRTPGISFAKQFEGVQEQIDELGKLISAMTSLALRAAADPEVTVLALGLEEAAEKLGIEPEALLRATLWPPLHNNEVDELPGNVN